MQEAARAKPRPAFAPCLVVAILAACASPSAPPQLGPEESFDGLRRVANTRASAAWIRPDFDVSGYSKVRLQGAGVEFRPVSRPGERNPGGPTLFPMTEEQRARLVQIVDEAMRAELARSGRFALVEAAGADVLALRWGLLDVVSFAPRQRATRDASFTLSAGEATLVVELRDSQSQATLARAVDRRAANRAGGIAQRSDPVTNWAAVRRLARSWATLVRTRLDASVDWRLAEP